MDKTIDSKEWDVPKSVILNVSFPEAFINAHSDINALNAFIVRESRKLGWNGCEIPNAMGSISHEVGLSMNGNAFEILGILYDYFRLKTLEKEAENKKGQPV